MRLQAWMQDAYSTQEITPEMSEEYTDQWGEILTRYGGQVLVDALRLHRRSSDFLPKLSEMERHVDAVVAAKRSANEVERTKALFAEEDAYKARAKAEGAQRVAPEKVLRVLEVEIIEMRATCQRVFGSDWRKRGDLTDVYEAACCEEAMSAKA